MSENTGQKEAPGSTQEFAFSAEAHKRAFQRIFDIAFPEGNTPDVFFIDNDDRKFILGMCLELVVSESPETPSTFRARLEDIITQMMPIFLKDKNVSKNRHAGERARHFADQLRGAYTKLYAQDEPGKVIDLDARRVKKD